MFFFQFRFDMTSSDEEDQEFMIALTQKTIRTATAENLTMGFTIIRVQRLNTWAPDRLIEDDITHSYNIVHKIIEIA